MTELVNGTCFICRKPAEVEVAQGESTGFRCDECGAYDLKEKDRGRFEQWVEDPTRRFQMKLAVKLRLFTPGPSNVRVLLDAEWLRKLTVRLRPENPG